MMDMSDMMEQCMNMMNGMMGGTMFVVLAALILFWLIGLAVVGGLGVWVYRRLRS